MRLVYKCIVIKCKKTLLRCFKYPPTCCSRGSFVTPLLCCVPLRTAGEPCGWLFRTVQPTTNPQHYIPQWVHSVDVTFGKNDQYLTSGKEPRKKRHFTNRNPPEWILAAFLFQWWWVKTFLHIKLGYVVTKSYQKFSHPHSIPFFSTQTTRKTRGSNIPCKDDRLQWQID